MNILMITTAYPPSTAIAAIRIWAYANYLCKMGHKVTVFHMSSSDKIIDKELYNNDNNVEIISYCEKNYQSVRKDAVNFKTCQYKKIYQYLKISIRLDCLWLLKYWCKTYFRYKKQKEILSKLNKRYDVVLSSFGDMENIFAGYYAKKMFNCPLVLDFRDPLPKGKNRNYSFLTTWLHRCLEYKATQMADCIIGVSKGEIKCMNRDLTTPAYVIHNGYVPFEKVDNERKKGKLIFTYTGSVYCKRQDMSHFFRALSELIDEKKVDKKNIQFIIAGKYGNILKEQAKLYGMDDIVLDYGYVTSSQANMIQNNGDIMIVLSWNNKNDEGVLTGKIFEGFRARKPIISLISGELPYSEIYEMNEKYKFGCVYEYCREREMFSFMKEYIYKQYVKKMTGEDLIYNPMQDLFVDFRYDNLAKKMEKVCLDAIKYYK